MQLVLGKKHLGNERIYRKRIFAKPRIEIKISENLRKPLKRKSTRKRIDMDFERVSFICALGTGAVHKNRKRLVLLCNSRNIHCLTSEFHVKFHAKNRYRTNREAMSAISVFQVKFNVEFARQAVNFSILLFTLLLSVRARCMTWRVNFVRSKDAQKQLARTSSKGFWISKCKIINAMWNYNFRKI